MTVSNDPEMYNDCYMLWEEALDSEYGIALQCSTRGRAGLLQLRLHKARAIMRENAKHLPPNHMLYGITLYDAFTVYSIDNTLYILRDILEERSDIAQREPEQLPFAMARPARPMKPIEPEPPTEAEQRIIDMVRPKTIRRI